VALNEIEYREAFGRRFDLVAQFTELTNDALRFAHWLVFIYLFQYRTSIAVLLPDCTQHASSLHGVPGHVLPYC
jgi:hypothetical protein